MNDAEVSLIFQFLGLVELGVGALLLQDLLHKALVSGFGEPALLIQKGQDARGASLRESREQGLQRDQGTWRCSIAWDLTERDGGGREREVARYGRGLGERDETVGSERLTGSYIQGRVE